MQTTYLAVAIWDYPDEPGADGRSYASEPFPTLDKAKEYAVKHGGHDSDALVKVYVMEKDADGEWIDVGSCYYWHADGEWGEVD